MNPVGELPDRLYCLLCNFKEMNKLSKLQTIDVSAYDASEIRPGKRQKTQRTLGKKRNFLDEDED